MADFSGINGKKRDLYVNLVKQKVNIEVNEEGSEAAAATVVGNTFYIYINILKKIIYVLVCRCRMYLFFCRWCAMEVREEAKKICRGPTVHLLHSRQSDWCAAVSGENCKSN